MRTEHVDVHPRRQLHHPSGSRPRQSLGDPSAVVLVQIGDAVHLVRDLAQQITRAGKLGQPDSCPCVVATMRCTPALRSAGAISPRGAAAPNHTDSAPISSAIATARLVRSGVGSSMPVFSRITRCFCCESNSRQRAGRHARRTRRPRSARRAAARPGSARTAGSARPGRIVVGDHENRQSSAFHPCGHCDSAITRRILARADPGPRRAGPRGTSRATGPIRMARTMRIARRQPVVPWYAATRDLLLLLALNVLPYFVRGAVTGDVRPTTGGWPLVRPRKLPARRPEVAVPAGCRRPPGAPGAAARQLLRAVLPDVSDRRRGGLRAAAARRRRRRSRTPSRKPDRGCGRSASPPSDRWPTAATTWSSPRSPSPP